MDKKILTPDDTMPDDDSLLEDADTDDTDLEGDGDGDDATDDGGEGI